MAAEEAVVFTDSELLGKGEGVSLKFQGCALRCASQILNHCNLKAQAVRRANSPLLFRTSKSRFATDPLSFPSLSHFLSSLSSAVIQTTHGIGSRKMGIWKEEEEEE